MASSSANQRFADTARALGLDPDITRFPENTRTAPEAAAAIGCELGQIVKSLVFACDGEPVLVLTSGSNQVDTAKVGELLGGEIDRADASAVRDATGFAIGGVPPFGHTTSTRTLLDEDLMQYDVVWGAAGTPDTVFPLAPAQLVTLSGAVVASVRRES